MQTILINFSYFDYNKNFLNEKDIYFTYDFIYFM